MFKVAAGAKQRETMPILSKRRVLLIEETEEQKSCIYLVAFESFFLLAFLMSFDFALDGYKLKRPLITQQKCTKATGIKSLESKVLI